MTPADNLARARGWVRCEIELTGENQPLCSVHGWDTLGCVTAFRETLAAAVRAKGEAALDTLRDPSTMGKAVLPRNPDAVWTVYVSMVEDALRSHVPPVPS